MLNPERVREVIAQSNAALEQLGRAFEGLREAGAAMARGLEASRPHLEEARRRMREQSRYRRRYLRRGRAMAR